MQSDYVTAHYIDLGLTEKLHKDRLRSIPISIRNTPPLALRCKLADCEPIDGAVWDPQANTVIAQITNNFLEPVMITVVDKTRSLYLVNMVRLTESCTFNISDTLIFLNLAATIKLRKDFPERSNLPILHMKTMPARNSIKPGAILEAKMSHIYDPSHFYIIIQQGFTGRKQLKDLTVDLQRCYDNSRGDHSMFNPQPGMYVAARFSGDKKWYRAEVISIPNVKLIEVFYIDFGNTEVLNWKNVKILFSKFFKLPPQAQLCCLAFVEPLPTGNGQTDKQWSKDVTDFFHKECIGISLRVIVDGIKDDAVSAVLYKNATAADICINALLVRAKYAVSTGVGSTVVEFPKMYELPKNSETYQCDVSLEKSKTPTAVTTKINKLTEMGNSSDLIKGPGGCIKIQVKIKRIVDPGEFYVALCYGEEELKKLGRDLQMFYGNSKPANDVIQWQINDKCVAHLNNKWFRTIILELLPDGYVELFIPDEGINQKTEIINLRPIDEKFLIQRDGVSRCHLGGLLPALESWSKTSITEFEEFAKSNVGNLYITKMTQSEIKGNSLAVELFNRNETPAGPLEAARYNWISFNHYLRMIGLAKADSVTKWDVDGNIISNSQVTNEEGDQSIEADAKLLQEILSSSFKPVEKIEETSLVDIHDIAVKWLPPEPVLALEFIGTPTFIDDNCYIYIQDFMRSTLTLPKISEDLTSKFSKTLPTQYDLNWTPGDICAAQYFVDNKWYRGEVKKLLAEGTTLVQFVDYGNADPCPTGKLRKKPSMTHIPIQATSFKLHTIASTRKDSKWTREELDEMHSSVATKNCRVELEVIAGGYGVKRLIMADGQDAIALWVGKKLARYSSESFVDYFYRQEEERKKSQEVNEELTDGQESEELVEEIDSESEQEETLSQITELPTSLCNDDKISDDLQKECVDEDEDNNNPSNMISLLNWSFYISKIDKKSSRRFEQLELQTDVETLSVEVTAVLSETELVFNICETNNVELQEAVKEFAKISEIMQKEASLQPLLEKPYQYKMCCAQFSADNSWYRAFVLKEISEDSLLIQYIDYGNVEILPAQKIHKIADEWIKPKAQSVLCCLHGVRASNKFSKKEIMEKVATCLSQNVLKAKIMSNTLIIRVELFVGDKLAYQPLIDEGILLKIND